MVDSSFVDGIFRVSSDGIEYRRHAFHLDLELDPDLDPVEHRFDRKRATLERKSLFSITTFITS
jgi:hypothetical protein